MSDHSWACPVCHSKNLTDAEVCGECGALVPLRSGSDSRLSATATTDKAPDGYAAKRNQGLDSRLVGDSPVAVGAKAASVSAAGGEPPIAELSPVGRGTEQASEGFFASRDSTLARARICALAGLLVALVVAVLKHGGLSSDALITVAILLLFALPIARYFREQLRFGEALVVLGDEAITAPILVGKEKTLRWTEIETITVDAKYGSRLLTFHLKAVDGLRDERRSWTGGNPARPTLGLLAFAAGDQEQLLDAVRRHHRLALSGLAGESATTTSEPQEVNELRESRQCQERIKALQPHTWATWVLIGVNVVIWLATLLFGAEFWRTPAAKLVAWGGVAAFEVQQGEWWRLLTGTFLHGGFVHLAINMLGLYAVGQFIERIYGARLLIIVYVGCGLLGSALNLSFAAQHAVSVGASGAVFGVVGALLVTVFRHRDKLLKSFSKPTLVGVGFFVFYALSLGFANGGVGNAAHLGGLLGGCLAAFILPTRFDPDHYRTSVATRTLATLALFALATASLVAMAPLATVASAPLLERVR